MTALRRDPVRVLVPATSANLGPAFDSAGLALAIEDELIAMVSDDPGVLIEVSGESATRVPTDDRHLVARSMALAFDTMDVRPTGFVLRCTNVIPHGRGLGSSAAAIVGGLVLARAMVDGGADLLSDDDILGLATHAEGHPDNVTATLHGGLTLACMREDGTPLAARLVAHPEVVPVVAIPGDAVPTRKARAVLPDQVPFADASFNIARSALLAHALTADPGLLMEATRDRLHQEPRRSMYAASLDLVDRLRARGIPAVISGAGPTVLALASAATAGEVAELADPQWRVQVTSISTVGAREVPTHP